MGTRRVLNLLVGSLFLVMAMAGPAWAGGRPLSANLTGAAEVGGGDTDGSGKMYLTLNQGQEQICWRLDVKNIAGPTRAHIHRGVAGVNGGVEVTFFDTAVTPAIPVATSGCVSAPKGLVKEIRQNPGGFYINIHNAAYPAGAVRGQLSK
jgi:hypothetical protein